MNKIAYPLKPDMQGTMVANLQDALLRCLDRGILPGIANDESTQRKWSAELQSERARRTYGDVTAKLVGCFQEGRRLQGNGEVDEPVASALNTLLREHGLLGTGTGGHVEAHGEKSMKITGTIVDAASQALAGYRVVAYHGDVNLNKEKSVAEARTGKDGKYSLTINLAHYPHGVNPRLVVFGARSKEIWSSSIQYNVKTDLVIDAAITDAQLGISEYQRLKTDITPCLQGLILSTLDSAQVTYLIGRSGVDSVQLRLLVTAGQLNEQLNGVPVEAFYGMLREGLPNTLSELVGLTERDWRAALDQAERANIIGPLSRPRARAIIAALNKQKAAEAIRPSTRNAAAGQAAFAAVALKSENKQQKIAELAARHNGVNGEFWRALERDRTLKADVESLKNHAAVAEILGNDPSILREVAAHFDRRGEKITPVALTKIDREQFGKIIEKAIRPTSDNPSGVPKKQQREAFARSMADTVTRKVAERFPTQLLREELSSTPGDTYFGKYKRSLSQVFEHNDLDLRGSFHSIFRPQDGSDPFRRIPDKNAVKERLGTLARLSRTLPVVEPGAMAKISLLAEKGFDSSFAISLTPKAQFLHTVDPNKRQQSYWSDVHDRAAAMRDIALLKGAEMFHTFRQPLPVMKRVSGPAQAGAAEWRTLFGSLDLCSCQACASITSPAAYLADILNFLGTDVAPQKPTTSPYDVLIARRPDIQHILLNCDNTNRELPYIDLVNELLQDEVLRQSGKRIVWWPQRNVTVDLPEATLLDASHDDAAAIVAKGSLVQALNTVLSRYDFSSDIHVSKALQGQRRSRWHLFERGWLVELSPTRRERSNLWSVDYISRQTYGTQAELAANPGFRNPEATEILEHATYPLSVPPGLPLLEARLFLEHLQVPRERLLKLLAPGDIDGWAVEYLGLSSAEASLITNTARNGQIVGPAAKWGFNARTVTAADTLVDPADTTELLTGIDWTEALSRVDVLIARAGITYIELLDLLDTYFVNPLHADGSRKITIQSTDKSDPATCDLSKLRIMGRLGWPRNRGTGLSAVLTSQKTDLGDADDFFDRLVRFLRLKRRTGWSSRDLDLAIRQVRPNVLDTKTLGLLATLKWTKDKLRLTHAQACALMGGIDTRRHIDHAADGQPTLPSQYEQLFLNRAITNPVDRNFTLDDTGNELFKTALSLAEGKAAISAAFEISNAEVSLLATKLGVQQLSLQALSRMYRRVLLARAFKLSVQQIIWLEELNSSSLDLPDQIPPFVERVTRLVKSGISANDAWFLLRKTEASTAYLMPRDEEITQTLGSLRDELKKIESEHESPDPIDPDGELLRKRLAELDWGEPLIDDLLSVITDTKVFSVHLDPLPDALRKLINPKPNEPTGVELAANASVPKQDDIDDLVAHDRASERLRALRPLTRADRRRLLCASGGASSFRKAVEQLYAIGRLSYDEESKTLSCRGLLPEGGRTALPSLPQPAAKAIDELFSEQQQLLQQKLRFCSLPTYEVPLEVATNLRACEKITGQANAPMRLSCHE